MNKTFDIDINIELIINPITFCLWQIELYPLWTYRNDPKFSAWQIWKNSVA